MSSPASAANKDLGLVELVAIALGGMIGGGIFSILGVAVQEVGNAAPIAIAIGAVMALLAAISYARLAAYYEDEGATYAFFKRTYPGSRRAAAAIGWLVTFGYVSTLALYAFTFASYLGSLFPDFDVELARPAFSFGILALLSVLNIVSVKLMGRLEDLMVYSKLVALVVVTAVLYTSGASANALPIWAPETKVGSVFFVAALTFVAFEGFQLAIHAYGEVRDPKRNVPRAIYASITIAALVYVLMSEAALWALDKGHIIADKEFALAAGAAVVLGPLGHALVMAAALLATSSAVSGTLFGASRLMAVIADDGYLPRGLARRVRGHTPSNAIVALAGLGWLLVLSGGLELILEFGSLTFIVVSLLMAIANFKLRRETATSLPLALLAVCGLAAAGVLIVVWQMRTDPTHVLITVAVAVVVAMASATYARRAPLP